MSGIWQSSFNSDKMVPRSGDFTAYGSLKSQGEKKVNIENTERIQEDDAAWIQQV